MNALKKVTLSAIGNGVAEELFGRELEAVLKNIADINTGPTDSRKITLEVTIKPNDTREMCAVAVRCKSTLSSVKPVAALFFMGKEGGKPVAYQNDPKQMEMPFAPKVVEGRPEVANA